MANLTDEIRQAISGEGKTLLVVDGNIRDIVYVSERLMFDDAVSMFLSLTKSRHPWCLRYDVFRGTQIVRGSKDAIMRCLGLKKEDEEPKRGGKRDENADLIRALKAAKQVGDNPTPINPVEVFPLFNRLFNDPKAQPTLLIIDEADAVVPGGMPGAGGRIGEQTLAVACGFWAYDGTLRKGKHLVVLMSRDAMNLESRMRDRSYGLKRLRIPKPDEDTRRRFIAGNDIAADTTNRVARLSAGLSLRDIETVLRTVKASPGDTEKAVDELFGLKRRILDQEYGNLVKVMDTTLGFDVIAGLEPVVQELRLIAKAMREGNVSVVPQGILLMGPPGTGKTLLAEACAKDAQVNFVTPLDIKSMWVGESERRMTQFINALRDLAPVCVFIDEFDQNQGQRGGFSGDSGVSQSLFKKMLEAMSDVSLRGQVLWIMATNRPDLIDAAMKRPGRCDLRIPLLPPDVNRLTEICKRAFKQFPDMKYADGIDWRRYAERCRGYGGADMVEVVRRAWKNAAYAGRPAIEPQDMVFAVADYRPQTADEETVAAMTLAAIRECSSESLLPPDYRTVEEECVRMLTRRMQAAEPPPAPAKPDLSEKIENAILAGITRGQTPS